MPGNEVIGNEERDELLSIFDQGNGVLFRHGFDDRRNNSFKVKEFENNFAQYIGSDYSLAVSSGTAALRVALAAIGVGEGDQVITQSFTFVATVEAIVEARATPIISEINSGLNIDPYDLEKKITKATKAVIVVHMLGIPCDMPTICDICRRHNLYLIEDTAWGLGASINGIKLGTWGHIGTFSFDFAKTLSTGEGGMLVFKDPCIHQKACAWHDHGHENNPSVPRWEDTRSSSGFNFRMTELQAAVGIAQLRKIDSILSAHRANKDKVKSILSQYKQVKFRTCPDHSHDSADAMIFFVDTSQLAIMLRERLLAVGIATKILPEALTWHFAGTWDHIPSLASQWLPDNPPYQFSKHLLSHAVSLPISVYQSDDFCQKLDSVLKSTLSQ